MWLYDLIDKWHEGRGKGPLHEYLGMSERLYKTWVEHPHHWVLGMDEVGYGAYAGPLVIGAVLAPIDWEHRSLKDSKAFSGSAGRASRARGHVLQQLHESPGASYFIERSPVEHIDRVGAYTARMSSFKRLAQHVQSRVSDPRDVLVVIDGCDRVRGIDHVALPKADTFVPQVMAASIVAKVYRDTEMVELAKRFPQYGFEINKGYGTEHHQLALEQHGPCSEHRRSYKPIKKLLSERSSSAATGVSGS